MRCRRIERGIGVVAAGRRAVPASDDWRQYRLRLPRHAKRAERIVELMDMVGAGPACWRRPHELSGGQQQRVALARAWRRSPG
jgi:cell division transport system ATP-binding protein